MDVSLLKKRFQAIKQETVDIAVSSINAYRAFIGNGVAVGKLAEPIFAKLLDAPASGFHAFHFAFTGKNPPFDVMLYKAEEEIAKTRFAEVRKLYASDFSKFHDAISGIVGGNNWCGISIKMRWTPKTGPPVKMDFRWSAGAENADDESKTQTA